jgi:ketosteroid isomerase-like protein
MNRVTALILVLSMASLACRTSANPTNRENGGASVRRMLGDFDRDAAKGSLDSMMVLFADDVVAFPAGQSQLTGKTALRSLWQQTLQQFDVRVVHDIAEVHAFGDVVVVNGRAHGAFVPKGVGRAVPVDNWFLHVYVRDSGGAWRLWRGGFAPNAPAATH